MQGVSVNFLWPKQPGPLHDKATAGREDASLPRLMLLYELRPVRLENAAHEGALLVEHGGLARVWSPL